MTTTRTWGRVIGASVGLIALLTALVAAFTWPLSDMKPRELPIAVAGPAGPTAGLEQKLSQGDALDTTHLDSREDAVAAIEDREVYGALVVGGPQPELLVASAASPAVATMLTEQVSDLVPHAEVTDVVALPETDPKGSVFASGALPLAIGGIVVGALTSMVLRRTRDRVVAAVLVAAGGGLTMAGVLGGWLDVLDGNYWAESGVIGLGILAIALPIIGLRHLIGPAGIAVMGVVVMLAGNPLSGVTSAPELLPLGWLGQLLPPGAVGTALRGTAFFDGAGVAAPLTVLGAWSVLGLACALVPRREEQSEPTEDAAALEGVASA